MTRRALQCARRAAVVGLALIALVACSESVRPVGSPARSVPEGAIVVASFDFAESQILAELYAAAIAAGGFPVTQLKRVASREIMEPALEQDQVDLVPEYQGTSLRFLRLDNGAFPAPADDTHAELTEAFAERGVTVLEYAPAENKNEVVVTRETAERHDLRRISDLSEVAEELIFGGPPECPSRPQCLQGLEDVYGLSFGSFQPLDTGGPLTVAALAGGEVDVATLFTTTPAIDTEDFVVLRDDRNLQPPENVVPVVRTEVVDAHGDRLIDTIDSVSERLSTRSLRALNAQVEIDGLAPAEVARRWLSREGLV